MAAVKASSATLLSGRYIARSPVSEAYSCLPWTMRSIVISNRGAKRRQRRLRRVNQADREVGWSLEQGFRLRTALLRQFPLQDTYLMKKEDGFPVTIRASP